MTFRLLSWNIEGFSKKVNDSELMDYLSSFDIFGLLETWECCPDGFENIFPEHSCLFMPAVKVSKYGRAMSGIMVYIKTKLMQYVKRLFTECNFGIFLLLDKTFIGLDKNTVLCFIYLPPEKSPFYHDADVVGIGLLENMITKLGAMKEETDLVIMGD